TGRPPGRAALLRSLGRARRPARARLRAAAARAARPPRLLPLPARRQLDGLSAEAQRRRPRVPPPAPAPAPSPSDPLAGQVRDLTRLLRWKVTRVVPRSRGRSLVVAVEEVVEDELVGARLRAQEPVAVHVHEALRDLVERDAEPPLRRAAQQRRA